MESTERSEDMSSSYIIERFLPDAAVLAAVTSAASQRKKLSDLTATVRQSCFSPIACGLHVLLPWSTKHRICGVNNAFSQPKFITKDN
ncbi:hypothetical protein HID58_090677 [Brassica napus]|uniref:Uncharacterized protein n=1 Tax=Brassica napus TaxID=3708 RepID=A0ABQ7XB58_BRANA|nr:hypothetical protein HID58_090677 [Brassica napus]